MGAKEPAGYVERDVITPPYASGIDAKSLKQSYSDTVALLKKRAAEETRDAEYQPQVGSYAVYPIGDARPWVVFGAVAPRKGVFYAIPYGHYASLDDYKNGRIDNLMARSTSAAWKSDGISFLMGRSRRDADGRTCICPASIVSRHRPINWPCWMNGRKQRQTILSQERPRMAK